MRRRPDFSRPAVGLALCALGAVTLGCRNEPEPGAWPQWRGPDSSGISAELQLPVTWSTDSSNVRWQVAIPGAGNSSPIVSGGRVFLTTASGDADDASAQQERNLLRRLVLGLDFATGKVLWQTEILADVPGPKHWMNTHAAPTPVTDGKHLFVYFGSVLASLDLDGNLAWQTEVEPGYNRHTRYGAASSPVLSGQAIILTRDLETEGDQDVGWLAAFDKASGAELWRQEWSDTCCSYSTPILVRRTSGTELLFAHSGKVSGYDAGTGEPLWSHAYPMTQVVPSPVIENDVLCVTGGGNRMRGTTCLRLTGEGPETRVESLWQISRHAAKTSSPILTGGMLFVAAENGVLTNYDAVTGEVFWQQRLANRNLRSSLVAGDGKVYVTDSGGLTSVVAAAPTFELLAENRLDDGRNSSAAIAGGCLLIRTASRLFCIEKEAERSAST
jgi:outer membrane protein assembly factor BamB